MTVAIRSPHDLPPLKQTLELLPIVSLLKFRPNITKSPNFSGEAPRINFEMKYYGFKIWHMTNKIKT